MGDSDTTLEQQRELTSRSDRGLGGDEPRQPDKPKRLAERLIPQTLRRMLRNPLGAIGFTLLVIFAAIAIAAPWLAPPPQGDDFTFPNYRIPKDGYSSRPTPPNPEAWQSFPPNWKLHPLGTASGQYDIYFGLVWGTQLAFAWAFIIVGSAVVIGIVLGSLAGYFGSWVDELIMRIVDVLYAFPNLLLAIVLLTVLSGTIPEFWLVVIALTSFAWLTYARILRGDILTVKNQEYVAASRAIGASSARLIGKHILPNAIYPVFVVATLDIGSIVVAVATLSFFGLGLPIGAADWGQLVAFSREWIIGTQGHPLNFWYTFIPPSAAITLFVLAWNLVGDAFRDVMDPRMKG